VSAPRAFNGNYMRETTTTIQPPPYHPLSVIAFVQISISIAERFSMYVVGRFSMFHNQYPLENPIKNGLGKGNGSNR